MQELKWNKLSDGIIGHETDILVQETVPVLNEYGHWESFQYMLLPSNVMYIDKLIDGCYVACIERID